MHYVLFPYCAKYSLPSSTGSSKLTFNELETITTGLPLFDLSVSLFIVINQTQAFSHLLDI